MFFMQNPDDHSDPILRSWETELRSDNHLLPCDLGLWQILEAYVNMGYIWNTLHILAWLIFNQSCVVGTISIIPILKIICPRSHN